MSLFAKDKLKFKVNRVSVFQLPMRKLNFDTVVCTLQHLLKLFYSSLSDFYSITLNWFSRLNGIETRR